MKRYGQCNADARQQCRAIPIGGMMEDSQNEALRIRNIVWGMLASADINGLYEVCSEVGHGIIPNDDAPGFVLDTRIGSFHVTIRRVDR